MTDISRTSAGRPVGLRWAGSIIVPAHNEQGVVARCLAPLREALESDEIEVIVVANGCTDATARVARDAEPRARVVEIQAASKPAALRMGESLATRMPRIYLDADVVIQPTAVRATLAALELGAPAARPPLVYDSQGATWPVRRYFRARTAMPSMHGHAWGAGVFGLSQEVRGRFDEFPDVVGDDLWVDNLLAPGELVVVETDPVIVSTPRDSRRLLRILRRAQRAKREAREAGSPQEATEVSALQDLLQVCRSRPSGVVDAAVYAGFAVAARFVLESRAPRWERDDSSREPAPR